MKLYRSGEAISESLPFADDNGKRLVPTSLSYRLLDDTGAELKAAAAILVFDAASGTVQIPVSSADNSLELGVSHGFRRIELSITTASYVYIQEFDYLLEATQLFLVGENSWQTYETALVTARMVTSLSGWEAATPENRKFALLRSFDQMRSFTYEFRYLSGESVEYTVSDLPAGDFGSLSTAQIQDFRKAQLVQADYLLGGNPIEKDIQDGLQSSTIGEISQFYRPRATLNLALCRAALSYVGKYIRWRLRVGRG